MVTRLYTFTYNSQLISEQVNKFSLIEAFDTAEFTVEFVLTAADPDTLRTNSATIEAALTARDNDLVVQLNASDAYNFSHANNTGMLGRPTLEKINDELSTATSRHYRWSCTFELPAEAARGYRRDGRVAILYDAARRATAEFTGIYTAGGGNSASTNCLANAQTWAGTILTALGLDFERRSFDYDYEDQDKLCNFRIVYQERFEPDQASGDHNAIEDASVFYEQITPQRFGGSILQTTNPQAPPVTISLSYTCTMNHDNLATDITAETVYRTLAKPWILQHAKDVLNLGSHSEASSSFIIQDESFNWNPCNCSLSGSISILSAPNTIIEYSETVSQTLNPGVTYEKLYDGLDYTYTIWGIGREIQATQNIVIVQLNSKSGTPTALANPPWYPVGSWNRYDEMYYLGESGKIHSGGQSISARVYRSTFSRVYIYVQTLQREITPGRDFTISPADVTHAEPTSSMINVQINERSGVIVVPGKSGGK